MSKRERKPPSKPSNAYLISFGDTMTAMLAFFIVLNTLAKEQTGANLHAGTGSFITAINSMGLPGLFSGDSSKQVTQMQDASPKYMVNDDQDSDDPSGHGPDDEDNELRVVDRDMENMQRVIVELEQQFQVELTSLETSSVAFDLFDRLGKDENILPASARKVLAQSMGTMSRPGYRMEVNLWSPTPSATALARTTKQAFQVRQAIRREFPVLNRRDDAIRATANLWPHSDDRRPIMSIILIKETPGR
ncbi:MAG: flagellar motor protein MotB [Pirellulaceae bacterium]